MGMLRRLVKGPTMPHSMLVQLSKFQRDCHQRPIVGQQSTIFDVCQQFSLQTKQRKTDFNMRKTKIEWTISHILTITGAMLIFGQTNCATFLFSNNFNEFLLIVLLHRNTFDKVAAAKHTNRTNRNASKFTHKINYDWCRAECVYFPHRLHNGMFCILYHS